MNHVPRPEMVPTSSLYVLPVSPVQLTPAGPFLSYLMDLQSFVGSDQSCT